METIKRYKVLLVSFVILGVITMALSLMSLKEKGVVSLTSWEAISILASYIIFHFGFLPLCYESWFREEKKNIFHYPLLVFYWLMVVAIIAISVRIGLYYYEST